MTVPDQIKILDRKIKQNEAQYDLDRKAKISALSSENLGKYEYLTGEDLDLNVDYDNLSFVGGNKKVYGLDSFTTFEKLMKDIRNKNLTIDKAEIKQNKFAEKLDELRVYPARRSKYIDLKESVFNVKNFVTDGKISKIWV